MSRGRLSARDKKVQKMSRDGLVERNITSGDETRVSMRNADFSLRDNAPDEQNFSRSRDTATRDKRQKRVQRKYHQPVPVADDTEHQPAVPHDEQPDGGALCGQPPHDIPAQDSPSQPIQPVQPVQSSKPVRDALRHDGAAPLRHEQPATSGIMQDKPHTALRQNNASSLRHDQPEPGVPPDARSQDTTRRDRRGQPSKRNEPRPADRAPRQSVAADTPPSNSSKLNFAPGESDQSPPKNRGLETAQRKYDRAAKKLCTAQDNLPTKRKIRKERVFDEESGRMRSKLCFDKEVVSQKAHVKGSLPLRPIKAAGNVAVGFAHKKMLQTEHENVGTKAAHRVEMKAEAGVRFSLHRRKTAPYRKVAKLERAATKKSMKLSYQKMLADNPKLRSNVFSRFMQKRKIKRQYAKAARDTRKMAAQAKRAGSFTARAARAIANVIRNNPKVLIVVGVIALIFMAMMSLVGMFASIGDAGLRGVLTASYLADNADINSVSSAYTDWETDLRLRIENVENEFPGFDEYRFYIDEIGHDPFVLMAYLTIIHQNFPFDAIVGELRALFDEQYTLTFEESVETRYYINDENERVYYDWHILTTRLVVRPLEDIVAQRLNEEQQRHFDILMDSRGGRQFAGSPFAFNWLPHISSHFGWRIDPFTGERAFHNGVDIAVPIGTPIIAAHDGIVTAAVWGTTGYGRYILLDNRNGLVTRYAHCDTLLVIVGQDVSQGDVIATSGNTGNSTGLHLHFEVILNGQYMNPVFFAQLSGLEE